MSETKNNKFSKPKRKRTIKRKPNSVSTVYFDYNTEKHIIEYQKMDDVKEKNDLYVKEIMPAFDSLVENLINVYGFKIMYETKKDLKSECMEFLFGTVDKFDKDKGSKAFSYFNVIAKNWLTIKSKQNVKRIKTYISSDEKENFTNSDLELFEAHNVVPSYEDLVNSQEQSKKLKVIIDTMKSKVKTENEKLCLYAVEQVLENIDDIDILNKRAILIYLRTLSGLSSKQLSIVLSSLKKKYKDIKKNLDND